MGWLCASWKHHSTQQCLKVMRFLCSCGAAFWEVVFSDFCSQLPWRDIPNSRNVLFTGVAKKSLCHISLQPFMIYDCTSEKIKLFIVAFFAYFPPVNCLGCMFVFSLWLAGTIIFSTFKQEKKLIKSALKHKDYSILQPQAMGPVFMGKNGLGINLCSQCTPF